MIQHGFEDLRGTVAKATCKRNSCFVVQSLDNSAVVDPFGVEVVDEQRLVGAEHAGNLLHWRETGAHGAGCPCPEVCGGPGGAAVGPEFAETLFKFPCAGGCPKGRKHSIEFVSGLAANFGPVFQEQEASALGPGSLFFGAQAGLLSTAHVVDGFVEMLGNMETVEHVDGTGAEAGDDIQEWLPHVRADDLNTVEEPGMAVLQVFEASAQGCFGPAHADVEKSPCAAVDLVDEGEEIGPFFPSAPVKFVNPQCGNAGEVTVFEAIIHDPVHRTVDSVPLRLEDGGHLFPGQAPGPAGQEDLEGFGLGAFAEAPWHQFHGWRAGDRADYPARGVVQKNLNPPKGDECPFPRLEAVVDTSRQVTARTAALAPRIGHQIDVDTGFGLVQSVADIFHGKPSKVLHVTENRFNCRLNGGRGVVCCATPSKSRVRHSQAKRVLPSKTHASLSARPAAPVKRAGDINVASTPQAARKAGFFTRLLSVNEMGEE